MSLKNHRNKSTFQHASRTFSKRVNSRGQTVYDVNMSSTGGGDPVDLSPYAKLTDIPDIPDAPDLSSYAKLTDIPDAPDLSSYAKKTDVSGVKATFIDGTNSITADKFHLLTTYSIPTDAKLLIFYGISSSSNWTDGYWSFATARYEYRGAPLYGDLYEASRVYTKPNHNSNTPVGSQALVPVITNESDQPGFYIRKHNYNVELKGYIK